MGESKFDVVGMLFAVTLAGNETASAFGASWVDEESGKTKVEIA
jgi:hypothetical protein